MFAPRWSASTHQQEFIFSPRIQAPRGPVDQLEDRYLGMVEAVGSNPTRSTSRSRALSRMACRVRRVYGKESKVAAIPYRLIYIVCPILNDVYQAILEPLWRELLTRAPLDAIPQGVWKRTGALNTWGTNAIEGNTLSREDVERILLEQKSVPNRPLNDVMETVQHAGAFEDLLTRKAGPISLLTVLQLHEAVFRGIKIDAGQWRRVNVRIAGTRHVPPRMEKVVPMMTEWEAAYAKRDMLGEDLFSLAALMHFVFESVHPFSDGNGRVGRLLLNLHFLKHNWPPVHVLPPDRERYLRCFDAADAGDLSAFEDRK